MNDDQRLLANAYLDGEVSDEERARAEADPDVMAEVARIAVVRAAIRVTEPPDPTRREAAIAAALDAFEIRPAATIATTPELPLAPPVSLTARRRARWLGPLAAAAAAVVVVAGGVALLRDGDDDAGDGGGDAATSATILTEQAPAMASAPDDAGGAELDTADAPADTAAAPAATEAAAEATAAAGSEGGLAGPDEAVGTDRVLTSPEDLADFAVDATTATDRTVLADRVLRCALGQSIGVAVYQRDGQTVAVEVFVDAGEAIAADATTCEVVARAQLP